MKYVGVIRFLGTNCDQDVFNGLSELCKASKNVQVKWLWYQDQFDSQDFAALVLPGGFSYGDYLRAGALAARAPIMQSLRQAVKRGVPTIGICNGFQTLCEAELLPGMLVANTGGAFIDDWV